MHYPVTRAVVGLSLMLTVGEISIRAYAQSQGKEYDAVKTYFMASTHSWLEPWTFLTAPYCGRRPALAALHIGFLAVALQFFERAWGSRSLLKYVLLNSVVPVFNAVLIDTLFGLAGPIGGAASLVIAFLVALKQANPFTYKLGPIEVKPKYLVMPALIFYTCLAAIDSSIAVMAWTALAVSWWYLRFVKSLVMDQLDAPSSGPLVVKGDRSDAFAFSKFFYPRQLTNLLSAFENRATKVLLRPDAAHQGAAERQKARGQQLMGMS